LLPHVCFSVCIINATVFGEGKSTVNFHDQQNNAVKLTVSLAQKKSTVTVAMKD